MKVKSQLDTIDMLDKSFRKGLSDLDDFKTIINCYFCCQGSPINYADFCRRIDELKADFKKNVYFVLPSARV